MLSIKRLYHWLPWLSALGLAVVFLAFLRHDLQLHERAWKEQLDASVQKQKDELERGTQALIRAALTFTQQLTADLTLLEELRQAQQIFSTPASTPEQIAAAREALYLRLEQPWQSMEQADVRQLVVYFAPGANAFLRMHHPDLHGDTLIGVRPLLGEAFKSPVPIIGADISRLGSGYRALVPITIGVNSGNTLAAGDSTQVIALLEVVMPSLPVRAAGAISHYENDDAAPPIHMAMFLRKAMVERMLWQQAREALTRNNPTVVDEWQVEETTDPQLNYWWNRGMIAVGEQGQLLREQDNTFLLSWLPVSQAGFAASESALAMAVWSDITSAYSHHQSSQAKAIAKWSTALACALLLLLLFVRFNRRYIRQLIERHREQMREEHAQSEQARQRLALALRSSDSGFWEWDIARDKASFSPEWRQWCGIGPESPDSQDLDEWMSRIHPADKRLSYTDIVRHIKGETPMYENEYRIKIPDGSYKWVLTRGKVVEWQPDGRAALMVGVYTDITARKNMELVSVRQQAAMHALNEIASLPAIDPAEQLRLALSLGARYLGLGHGMIGEVIGDTYRVGIEFAHNNKPVPVANHLAKTYCSLTVALSDVFAEDDIPASQYRQHPAYLLTQVESYIGAPLWIGDRLYGTLSFFSRWSRHHQYDALDKDFMRLLARWISSVVERWQQEREIKVILDRFHKLSGRLPGFLYQFQLLPDGQSFFPYSSAGIKTIYNLSPEDALESADKVFAAIHPGDVDWVRESVMRSARQLSPWVATVRVNNPVRGMIWTHIESIPEKLEDGSVLWNGYVADVTPLKEAELKIQETSGLQKAILDAASVSIISVDTRGIIKTFNRGAELMLGYSAVEAIDQHTPLIVHLEQEIIEQAHRLTRELGYEVKPDLNAFIAKARVGGTDEREWTFVRKDGTQFPVILTVSALRNNEGKITGYLGVARDISEIKRIDRMKNEFISTVSHELRTPLTAISGALGIVANGLAGELPDKAARMIQIAHNNSQRLIRLVNDLLDMEKLVAGKMDFDLQSQPLLPLIQQSLESNAEFAAQYGVTYRLSEVPGPVDVIVDAQRLLQVMANYLSNAAKFSPENDEVVVAIETRRGSVRVSVTDKGPGIPEDFRMHLFQKFSQADASDKRQKGGTGLGLAICKEIIERMGGAVGAESTPGQGACFYFDLPCLETAMSPDALPDGSIP